MIIVGVIVLVVVLFILLIIPASKTDVLDNLGSDAINFGSDTTTSTPPVPTITELQGQDILEGTGSAQVKGGDTIIVHYTGYFLDGKKFDSSYDNNQPLTVVVGKGQLIQGFEQGVIGMKLGGQRRIIIPPSLAYGEQGSGAIPPNTPIAFDIELLEISIPPASSPEPTPEEEEEEENGDEENNDEENNESNDEESSE